MLYILVSDAFIGKVQSCGRLGGNEGAGDGRVASLPTCAVVFCDARDFRSLPRCSASVALLGSTLPSNITKSWCQINALYSTNNYEAHDKIVWCRILKISIITKKVLSNKSRRLIINIIFTIIILTNYVCIKLSLKPFTRNVSIHLLSNKGTNPFRSCVLIKKLLFKT